MKIILNVEELRELMIPTLKIETVFKTSGIKELEVAKKIPKSKKKVRRTFLTKIEGVKLRDRAKVLGYKPGKRTRANTIARRKLSREFKKVSPTIINKIVRGKWRNGK